MRTKHIVTFVLLLCCMLLIVSCAGQNNYQRNDHVEQDDREVVAENEVFRLFAPVPQDLIETTLIVVSGEAKISGSNFYWTLEDGHNILASGELSTEQGTWEAFEFEVAFDKPSSPGLSLVMYTMIDEEIEKQLIIPMKASETLIERHS